MCLVLVPMFDGFLVFLQVFGVAVCFGHSLLSHGRGMVFFVECL